MQHPDMTLAVGLNVKHNFKQTNTLIVEKVTSTCHVCDPFITTSIYHHTNAQKRSASNLPLPLLQIGSPFSGECVLCTLRNANEAVQLEYSN